MASVSLSDANIRLGGELAGSGRGRHRLGNLCAAPVLHALLHDVPSCLSAVKETTMKHVTDGMTDLLGAFRVFPVSHVFLCNFIPQLGVGQPGTVPDGFAPAFGRPEDLYGLHGLCRALLPGHEGVS